MTNEDVMRISLSQSAIDLGCKAEDFLSDKNVIVPFSLSENAKRYYKMPISANFVSYGNNVVASATAEIFDIVKEYTNKFEFYHCFESPNMKWLNDRLSPFGQTVCFMAEYYLPDVNKITGLSSNCAENLKMRVLEKADFASLYLPQWSNALCSDRKELDVLCVGAYDEGKLVGLAGCSADAEEMWQIGVDVLPSYRRKGIATALTSRLSLECLERGKVPFYCTAWSNIRSVRNAIKCGFLPSWAEMTVKPIKTVDEMNA